MVRERNNFKAGLFVLVGVTLMFVAIVLLADIERMFTPTQAVTVRFGLSDGLQGLKDGAEVTIGHATAGTVTEIDDVPSTVDPAVVVAKDVRFTIPARYQLYDNAQIELVVPPLGSGTKLNIRSFGEDGGDAEVDALGNKRTGPGWTYAPDEVIPGGIAPSQLTAGFVKDLGIEDTQRAQIQNIIANVERLTAELGDNAKPVGEIIVNIRDITAGLKADVPELTEKAKSVLARADDALEQVQGILAENRETIRSAIARVDEAVATVQEMLNENRESIRNTLANAESITDTLRNKTVDTLNSALAKADESLETVRVTVKDLQVLLVTQSPIIEQALANLRLTSDQLKLASIEVRRAPWRLLYTPSEKELQTDAIYDASRSFAMAASTLQATTDSMTALLDRHGNHLNTENENLRLMLDNLHQSFEQFLEAETRFWDALRKTSSN